MSNPKPTACPTCGSHSMMNFCPNCGEKKFTHHELTLKHFFAEALESFVHFDNKFIRSLKTLVMKPGQLSLEFTEGIRVRFMKPLQLFIVMNLIFFFIFPANPFALPLFNYTHYKPFVEYNTVETVTKKMHEENMSDHELATWFNGKMKVESKEFIFLYVIFYALLFALLMMLYKRSITEHLIFSAHFMSFYILFSIASNYLITWPFYRISHLDYSEVFDSVTTTLTSAIIALYLFLAIRKFYRAGFLWSLFCSLLVGGSFFYFIQFYRMFLFNKIMVWE